MKNIGPTIKRLRKERKMTQKDVSRYSLISQTYLSQIESGNVNPSIDVLKRIGAAIFYPWEVILFLSMKVEDVPILKQKAFKQYYPPISEMIKALFTTKPE